MDSHLEELKLAVESMAEGMSREQLSWHPTDKWSAAEVLEHLYLTYSGTIKGFAKVMQGGNLPAVGSVSMKHRLQTLVVVGLGHMPAGRQAPATTVPRGLQVEKVRSEVGAKIVEMDAIIAQCEARFGRHVRLLDHPILGPLTATQWRKFHLVHGRHHAKQILWLRENMKAKP